MKTGGLGQGLEFLRVLWELDHALHRASKAMSVSLGVTGPQRLVVRFVGRFPGLPAGDLAAFLHVDPSTLTGVLARLERQGLLARRVDPRDRRRALFTLTPRGKRLDRIRKRTVEGAVLKALGRQGSLRVTAARRVLTEIARQLASECSD
jgi:DNA-binding MarR family transcriptional regulator